MFVREAGRGSPVLLLHGLPSPAEDLLPLSAALAEQHRVLLPDLPGYGATPAPAGTYSFASVQRAIETVLAEHDARELAIVGFSGGAYRALALALGTSVHVTRVVCLGGTPGPSPEDRIAMRGFAAWLRSGADLRAVMAPRMLSTRAQSDAEAVHRVESWLELCPPEVLAAELDGYADAEDLRVKLDQISSPLLLRVGSEDAAAPVALSEEIARAVPRARLEVVEGAGHALLIEDLPATIDVVRSFLE